VIRVLAVLTFIICGVILAVYLLVRAGQFGRGPKRDQLYEAARWPVPLDSEEARRNRRVMLTLVILAAAVLVAALLGWVYL
jgi:heme A synthase